MSLAYRLLKATAQLEGPLFKPIRGHPSLSAPKEIQKIFLKIVVVVATNRVLCCRACPYRAAH
jgi:hypothetical protein